MAEFIIKGGKKLKGEIEVHGAKNAALKALASSLLFSGPITVKNLPWIEDVFRMKELLEELGVKVSKAGERGLKLDAKKLSGAGFRKEIAKSLRASVVLTGPLLAREKKVIFPHPGGDVIGKRPIDIFLEGFRAFGAKIRTSRDNYEASAEKLKGADFTFKMISVSATETLMMAAVLAKGRTILRNAALEPEIESLANFLNKNGARIRGAGTPTVEIAGQNSRLLRGGGTFEIIPDRIDAGSFLILGAALGARIKIKKCNPLHLAALIFLLESAGVKIKSGPDWLLVSRPRKLTSLDAKTREYPGFATDLQAPFTVLMTQARGQAMIFETVFEGRLNYIEELNRMGAKITPCDPHRILVHGPTPLRGRDIEAPDIRAGLAFIIAALVAKGESRIKNIYQIDRGYERIEERLQKLGADIERV
ncbi:MAG: UDP-N-acetylglucosamine 1-carboxyvinyltransferase [bacterium]|nr:UDP-N-acetylglucosamine 1-carboxyvinyltransferase [bacterium]